LPRILELARRKGLEDVLIIAGGIIPDVDIPSLKKAGLSEVFQPGASTQEIIDFIFKSVERESPQAS